MDRPLTDAHEHEHEGEDHEAGEHEHEGEDHETGEHEHEGEDHDAEAHEHEHEHEGGDPHTWTDPNNVILWVEAIAGKLSELDPAHAEDYDANAAAYTAELEALDAWIL